MLRDTFAKKDTPSIEAAAFHGLHRGTLSEYEIALATNQGRLSYSFDIIAECTACLTRLKDQAADRQLVPLDQITQQSVEKDVLTHYRPWGVRSRQTRWIAIRKEIDDD